MINYSIILHQELFAQFSRAACSVVNRLQVIPLNDAKLFLKYCFLFSPFVTSYSSSIYLENEEFLHCIRKYAIHNHGTWFLIVWLLIERNLKSKISSSQQFQKREKLEILWPSSKTSNGMSPSCLGKLMIKDAIFKPVQSSFLCHCL